MTIKKTVLIADGFKDKLGALSQRCRALDLNVVTAVDGFEAMAQIGSQPPELVILNLDTLGTDGIKICEQMAREDQTSKIPVIILTARSYQEAIDHCESLGAYYVFKDKQAWKKISYIIQNELGVGAAPQAPKAVTEAEPVKAAKKSPKPKILIVDDDLNILQAFTISLSSYGAKVVTAENGMEAFNIASIEMPDVIVTDYTMPGGSGEYLLNRLKSDPETKNIPVIVLTGRTFERKEDVALKRDLVGRGGAVAYLNKPLDTELFITELQKHIVLDLHYRG